MSEKLPPSDIESEEAVLGACFIAGTPIQVATILKPEDFYRETHAAIYAAMLSLMEKGQPLDLLTLCNEMGEDANPPFLTGLISAVPSSIHAEYYAGIVAEKATRRRMIDAATKAVAKAWDEDCPVGEVWTESVRDLVATRRDGGGGPVSFKDAVGQSYDRVEAVARQDVVPVGVPTGFHDLDELVRRLMPKNLVILAARPSVGKTSLALNIAAHASRTGKRVLVFSLETSREAITTRIESQETGIPFEDLEEGKLGGRWDLWMRAVNTISEWTGWIDDTPGIMPGYLRAETMRKIATDGVDLVIVDYLQLMRQDGKQSADPRWRYTEIVQAVKGVAKDLGVPILLLSQLARAVETRQDKRPMLSDLLETGAIEAAADVVMFIYREELYDENTERKGLADIIVAKHRNGPTGTAVLHFERERTRFWNVGDRVTVEVVSVGEIL